MAIDLFVVGILMFSPAALWGALCAINSMRWRETRRAVAFSFLLIAWGWGAVTFAAIDYLVHGSLLFWPYLLLFGVMLLAGGNSILYLMNRRECRCLGCPGVRAKHGHSCRPTAEQNGGAPRCSRSSS